MPKRKKGTLLTQLQEANKGISPETPEACEAQIAFLKRELELTRRKLAREKISSSIMIDELRNIFEDRPIVVEIPKRPELSVSGRRVEIPVLAMGDWHLGHSQSGQFAYNNEICEKRVHATVDKFIATLRDRRTSACIEEMRLYLLGDMVEGEAMRPGHAHHIGGSVFRQACLWAPSLIASVVTRLLGEFQSVKIVGVPGNHGRNGPKKGDAAPETNWDSVVYEVARHIVSNAILQSRHQQVAEVTWDLPADRMDAEDAEDWLAIDYVFNWCNLVLHGESNRSTSGGTPFYGIERLIKKCADVLADPFDFVYMGHVHVDADIPSNYRGVFINGATQSTSLYARKDLVTASPPSQSAVFYTDDHGPVSRHTFYLDDRCPTGMRTLRRLEQRGLA